MKFFISALLLMFSFSANASEQSNTFANSENSLESMCVPPGGICQSVMCVCCDGGFAGPGGWC